MTTNKVHDPRNKECPVTKMYEANEWIGGGIIENHCTCEKQQQAEECTDIHFIKDKCSGVPFPQEKPELHAHGFNTPCPSCATPTSVTGEEWEEEFDKEFPVPEWLKSQITDEHMPIASTRQIKDFIRNLLSAQRTHIKQALLGRMEILRKHPQVQSGDADPCGLLLDIINIINEELA